MIMLGWMLKGCWPKIVHDEQIIARAMQLIRMFHFGGICAALTAEPACDGGARANVNMVFQVKQLLGSVMLFARCRLQLRTMEDKTKYDVIKSLPIAPISPRDLTLLTLSILLLSCSYVASTFSCNFESLLPSFMMMQNYTLEFNEALWRLFHCKL